MGSTRLLSGNALSLIVSILGKTETKLILVSVLFITADTAHAALNRVRAHKYQ